MVLDITGQELALGDIVCFPYSRTEMKTGSIIKIMPKEIRIMYDKSYYHNTKKELVEYIRSKDRFPEHVCKIR